MLRRSPFRRRPPLHEPSREREPRPMAKPERWIASSPVADSVVAVPKPESGRNRALLDMAQGRRCLLLAVEGCEGASGLSTVACPRSDGKGMAQKQSDERSAWGCAPCHRWLDQSGSPRDEKRRAFDAAHIRQIAEWRRIEQDQSEPERFRKAARWALDRIEGGQK